MRRSCPEHSCTLASDQAHDTLMDWDSISARACESKKATSEASRPTAMAAMVAALPMPVASTRCLCLLSQTEVVTDQPDSLHAVDVAGLFVKVIGWGRLRNPGRHQTTARKLGS